MEENNKNWIKELKAGDAVAIKHDSLSRISYSLHRVKNITKGGNVRVDNGELYDVEGFPKGSANPHSWGNHKLLIPYDDDLKSILRKNKLVKELKNTDFSKFDLEVLEALKKIVEEEEEK